MFKRIRGERGFTLVELLVVLAVLAILIAIVVPNLAGITSGARKTAAQTELSIVQTAIDTLMADQEVYSLTATTGSDAEVGPNTKPEYWYVNQVDPGGTEHTTNASNAPLTLRVTSTGKYVWDQNGKVTQTDYAVAP